MEYSCDVFLACCLIIGLISSLFTVESASIIKNNKQSKNPIRSPIHFNQNGRFKIVNFADLHYGEDQAGTSGPANDLKSTKVMQDILSWESPDFVVFTGDLISGEVFPSTNGTAYIDMLLQPVVHGGYPWASTYGNHDVGRNIQREEILQTEQKYINCYTQQGQEGLLGNTNYYVPIYPPLSQNKTSNKNETEVPAIVLWFFDTRGGQNASGGISAYVHESVVEWFRNESTRLREIWGPVPSYAYFHYPTAEYSPIHDNLDLYPECIGQKDDIVTPQEKDTGFMQALVNSGVIKASFVGHNHGNGWCCSYRTMQLCYNRQSGHGGGWIGWVRGARVVEINYNDLWGRELNYIRLENGTIVDRYPRQF